MGLPLIHLLPYDKQFYLSDNIMRWIEQFRLDKLTGSKFKLTPFTDPEFITVQGRTETPGSAALSTFLMTRPALEYYFLNKFGYTKGRAGDFGILDSKVSDKSTPVYQTSPDYIDRDSLTYIGQYGLGYGDDTQLHHAGSHAGEIYMTYDGNLIDRKLDYNNYGIDGDNKTGIPYEGYLLYLANKLDEMGSPVVVSSGYQPVRSPMFNPNDVNTNRPLTINDVLDEEQDYYLNENMIKTIKEFAKNNNLQKYDDKYIETLPEVTVVGTFRKKPIKKLKK